MDLLKASHGPKYSPEIKAKSMMLMSSHIFVVVPPNIDGGDKSYWYSILDVAAAP